MTRLTALSSSWRSFAQLFFQPLGHLALQLRGAPGRLVFQILADLVLEVFLNLGGMDSHVVEGPVLPGSLQMDILRRLGLDRNGARLRIHRHGHAVLGTDQNVSLGLETTTLEFLGQQAGHLFSRQHFQQLQLGADPIVGVQDTLEALATRMR